MQTLAELSTVDPSALVLALADQRAPTIALVLRYLPAERAPQIVGKLDRDKRLAVARCLASPATLRPDVQTQVARGLHAQIRQLARGGGPLRVSKILEQCDRALEWSIVRSLQSCDSDLADAIRQATFCFEDIAKLTSSRAQSLLKNIELKDWALALNRSEPALKRKIATNLTRWSVEKLNAEIDYWGAATAAEVEQAQQKIVDVARRLAASRH